MTTQVYKTSHQDLEKWYDDNFNGHKNTPVLDSQKEYCIYCMKKTSICFRYAGE